MSTNVGVWSDASYSVQNYEYENYNLFRKNLQKPDISKLGYQKARLSESLVPTLLSGTLYREEG